MAPKKAISRQGSSRTAGGDASPLSPKSEISELGEASPKSTASKKSSKKKAAEEAKRKAEAPKAELKRQQEEAQEQLKETLALKEQILAKAMGAANACNGFVGAGFRHSAVVTKDGGLVCFGTSGRGQCDVPHASVTGYRAYHSVACGHLHTCASTVTGQVVCFGDESFGQCAVPPHVRGISAMACGFGHTCVLDAQGQLHCFGDNLYGQCQMPIELASTTVVALAAGFRHSCAVTAQGALLCWGDNSRGQCSVPRSLDKVRRVAAGDFHTCAITADGKLHCFGSNDHGQCSVPSDVEHVIAVAAGSNFTVAFLYNGTAWSGGSWGHGQTELPEEIRPEAPLPEEPVESEFGEEEEEVEQEEREEEVDVSCEVHPTEEMPPVPTSPDGTETEVASEMQKRMTSTFGSLGESLVESLAADPTISSLISEAQESLVDPEEQATRKIKALLDKLAAAWEEAEAFAAQYVDRFRGMAAGCLHSCLLLSDGQFLVIGDDSANQCTLPEGLVPKVPVIDEADLPLGVLVHSKPKLLLPPEEVNPEGAEAPEDSQPG